MPTVNEKLLDGEIHHQVDLTHYSNGVMRRIMALMNRTDPDLFAQIGAALERLPAESFTVDRLEALLGSVRFLNQQAYEQLQRALADELLGTAQQEADFQAGLWRSAVPAEIQARIAIAPVNAEAVYAAAMSRPFQGRLLREFAAGLGEARMLRMRDAIRIGYVEQQTVPQIVQRLRGTRAKGYSDGLIEIDRRNAESVVRTAVGHVAGFARDRFMEANSDLIKAEEWVSTLDSRTSEVCRLRDGKRYTPVSHKPIGHSLPWLGGPGRAHWGCRSSSTPITKSWKELGIPIDELPESVRASMDGEVPASMTYGQWLRKQSASRQDEILGPARGKLMRQGGLTLDKFANDRGRWLSLAELRERNAAAFKRAGVASAA